MSYTLDLHNLLRFYLNEFYDEYNIDQMSEEDIHQSAAYFTHSTKDFLKDNLANIVDDPTYQDYLDAEMCHLHTKFTTLCNAALSELIYTYIIENY